MVLFGTKGGMNEKGRGLFRCPQCKSDQQYTHIEVVRKGHLYFIPLIELGKVGEYVQCENCNGQFSPTVLTGRARSVRGAIRHVEGLLAHRTTGTGFLVLLKHPGSSPGRVAWEVKGPLGLKLGKAFNLVQNPPVVVADRLSGAEAHEFAARLRRLGATVSVRHRTSYRPVEKLRNRLNPKLKDG